MYIYDSYSAHWCRKTHNGVSEKVLLALFCILWSSILIGWMTKSKTYGLKWYSRMPPRLHHMNLQTCISTSDYCHYCTIYRSNIRAVTFAFAKGFPFFNFLWRDMLGMFMMHQTHHCQRPPLALSIFFHTFGVLKSHTFPFFGLCAFTRTFASIFQSWLFCCG